MPLFLRKMFSASVVYTFDWSKVEKLPYVNNCVSRADIWLFRLFSIRSIYLLSVYFTNILAACYEDWSYASFKFFSSNPNFLFVPKYHPDVNKDPGALEKFKEISAAYEVWMQIKTGKFCIRYSSLVQHYSCFLFKASDGLSGSILDDMVHPFMWIKIDFFQ